MRLNWSKLASFSELQADPHPIPKRDVKHQTVLRKARYKIFWETKISIIVWLLQFVYRVIPWCHVSDFTFCLFDITIIFSKTVRNS